MPSTTAINKRNVHVLTSSTLEYDLGNSLYRCHQVKMGSLARTQSSMTGGLMKRGNLDMRQAWKEDSVTTQREDGQVTGAMHLPAQEGQRLHSALGLPGRT